MAPLVVFVSFPAGAGDGRPGCDNCRSVARSPTAFVCSSCGHQSPKWLGRCPECAGQRTRVNTPAFLMGNEPRVTYALIAANVLANSAAAAAPTAQQLSTLPLPSSIVPV